ncbi:hypothetical protein AURDEDRAFT_176394 [Auricularia subglabra TFB-10046 SS5]|uniref:Uncharacterized protein n=1 Tax=Auricularia subglabra (strain TFB-10046 / SS5) TaxID=717982 RepID=J0CVV4_AURST|nr:hypothetical protein AURDEDRAFT_176394 [Auricularia subglabra TFB-10046 SS5]
MADVRDFIAIIASRMPKHQFCTVHDSTDCRGWFLRAINAIRAVALRLWYCYITGEGAFSVTAVAWNAEGHARETRMDIPSLMPFVSVAPMLDRLEELTIEEMLYTTSQDIPIPPLLRLRSLTIEMEHPRVTAANGHDGLGILLLPLEPDRVAPPGSAELAHSVHGPQLEGRPIRAALGRPARRFRGQYRTVSQVEYPH